MARVALALFVVAVLVVGGLSLGDSDERPRRAPTGTTPAERPAEPAPTPRVTDRLRAARCADDGPANCAAVTGRVLVIESVDADGDGDLHVIAAGGAVTAPGITVFDVRAGLRPRVDPRPGDRVTGAGPVYRGSYGQRQIQVTEFRVSPRR
jgi:hypothetical protein